MITAADICSRNEKTPGFSLSKSYPAPNLPGNYLQVKWGG